jgi:DNA polymerase-3 subunit epsilon
MLYLVYNYPIQTKMHSNYVHTLCDRLGYPLVFFDVETTGLKIYQDRILQISITKFFPGTEDTQQLTTFINPREPFVPNEVNNITPQLVANSPTIEDLVDKLTVVFTDSIIIGFNSDNFDIPILREEFARIGRIFPRYYASYDAYAVFTKFSKKNLNAAVKTYLNREQENAHSSYSDVIDTIEVFNKQLEVHELLSTIKTDNPALELVDLCSFNQYCDAGKTIRRTSDGDYVLCGGAVDNLSVFNPLARTFLENAAATSSSLDTRMVCEFFLNFNLSLQNSNITTS